MANKYLTNIIEIVTGIASLNRRDGNPYEGEMHGLLRFYRGVKSYDILAHGDEEEALMAYVTDWNQLVIVARTAKLADIATCCAAEDADYHYEERSGGRIVVRMLYKERLERRLLGLDYSYEEPDDGDYDEYGYYDEDDPESDEDEGELENEESESDEPEETAAEEADEELKARIKAAADAKAAKAQAEADARAAAEAAAKAPGGTNWKLDLGNLDDFS